MEIKDRLEKPYTETQRCDFIVKNNHQSGYEIQETDDALLAVYNEPLPPTEEEQRENRARAYQQEVDPLHSRKQRKIILGEWTEDDEREYILKVKELSDKIVKEYPYEAKNNET